MTDKQNLGDAILPDAKAGMHSHLNGAPYIEYEATSLSIIDHRYIPDPGGLTEAIRHAPDFATAYLQTGYGRMSRGVVRPYRFRFTKDAADGLRSTLRSLERSCDLVRHEHANAHEWIFMARRPGALVPAASLVLAVELWQDRKPAAMSLAVAQHGFVPGVGAPDRPTDFAAAARAFGDEAITDAFEPMAEGTWSGARLEDVDAALLAMAGQDARMRAAITATGKLSRSIVSKGSGSACHLEIESGGVRLDRADPRLEEIARRFNYTGRIAIHKPIPRRPLWTRVSSYEVEGDFLMDEILRPSRSATINAAVASKLFSEEGLALGHARLAAYLANPVVAIG